jgi:hypothetical protein
MHTKFSSEYLKVRDHAEEVDMHGKIILEWILRGFVDWMHFAQGRDQWREIVNTVMNLRIS